MVKSIGYISNFTIRKLSILILSVSENNHDVIQDVTKSKLKVIT